MHEVLTRFVRALRAGGVRVSLAEEIDAASALGVVGMHDRGRFRAALFATLVKDRRDLPVFDRLFEAFFGAPAALDLEPGSRIWAALAESLDGRARQIAAAMASADTAALEALFAEANESIDLPLRYPFQRGLLAHRMRERLEMERIRRAMSSPGQGGGLSAGVAKAPTASGQAAEEAMRALEAALDAYVARQVAKIPPSPSAGERSGMYAAFDLDERETDAVARAAEKLAKRLREQSARRKRRAKRGRIDVRNTLRHSIASGGVPFVPRWRRVRPDRPNLVALCDVSPSMRSATRFTLMFLHSIAAEVARVRSFFFVDRTAEVTGFFRERRIGRALARALAEADVDVGARTDYGASFRDFDKRFSGALDKRTTLIILGDARSNYTDPGVDLLRAWKRRVKRIVFLNPESPPFWGTGDSAMIRFAPLCDVVAECRTPAHLQRVVDALSGHPSETKSLSAWPMKL